MSDRELNEIKETVKQAQMEVSRQNEEVWLSTNEFLKQFQMFTKDWLEHYGWKLPRERAEVTEDCGTTSPAKVRVTRWAYPRNEIQRMIRDRELLNL